MFPRRTNTQTNYVLLHARFPNARTSKQNITAILKSASVDLFREAWRLGIPVSSHYSGCAGDVVGLGFVNDAARLTGDLGHGDPGFYLVDACDCDKVCQKVLTGFSAEALFKPKHVFADMMDRTDPEVREVLNNIAPKKGDEKEMGCTAFEAMREVLSTVGQRMFRCGAVAPCVLHGVECPLYTDDQPEHDYRVWWAGTTCLDVTRAGARAGFYGPHSKVCFFCFLSLFVFGVNAGTIIQIFQARMKTGFPRLGL